MSFLQRESLDAHHIVERKLFTEGGYYLENGAAVCEKHHWMCETTELTVEGIRKAAGIGSWCFPKTFVLTLFNEQRIDKWAIQCDHPVGGVRLCKMSEQERHFGREDF